MAKITFSDENQAGDIPTYELTKDYLFSEYLNSIHEQLDLRNGKVIVCFQSWKYVSYEDVHNEFLITENDADAYEYFEMYCRNISCEEINFNFFCFDTYEDAFKYCIDLKEGL